MSVRVRFAPSPTGHVHIGNIRAAIFNWLYARHSGGKFLLRVEDTDRERSTPEAIETLLDAMDWLGLDVDEPPLYQSARSRAHLAAAETLIAAGRAYRFAKGGEGEAVLFRIPWDDADGMAVSEVGPASLAVHPDVPVVFSVSGVDFAGVSSKGKPMPGGACLAGFRNLTVFDSDGDRLFELEPVAEGLLTGGKTYTVERAARFEFTRRQVTFTDLVKGDLSKPLDGMKDVVIVRSDGSPVFHLANVCDDIEQNITHIIRGDDHVENTYRHLLLFAALGAPAPAYAHLPMIVNAHGKPYSKRDGDAFVGDFRDRGFLPAALFNYLTLLGWNPGDEREKMTREELVQAFSLDRVQHSAAQMDMRKLENLNGQYIADLPVERFLEEAALAAAEEDRMKAADPEKFAEVARLLRSRTKTFADVKDWGYFFSAYPRYDEKAVRKFLMKDGVGPALTALAATFEHTEFDLDSLEAAVQAVAEERGFDQGKLNAPLRVALTGRTSGAGMGETMVALGREHTLNRLRHAVAAYCDGR
ncbi:MAG: glutamate--tRNA ligase family protein [Lentisphaeria bacterium]|nr:glutamate--tRNA ligase family protein [Lentisphaeria bacterium]